MPNLIIHAVNVHQGGGKALLLALLGAVQGGPEVTALLDRRMELPAELPENVKVKFVNASIWGRFCAERWLTKHAQSQDTVLCFGNLPPIFKLKAHVIVFVQNRYLVENIALSFFSLKTHIRILAERFWLLSCISNANEFVVQTWSMMRLLKSRANTDIKIRVLPFVENIDDYFRKRNLPRSGRLDADFLYVASGEPHKNHRCLIEAWCLLAKDGVLPSLTLTLDKSVFVDLCSWIEHQAEKNKLNIKNVGNLAHTQVKDLYRNADALIYPSYFESFGLPLIEASQAELPILASELDYVRDVIDPEHAFDPHSPVSIARAVKRFLEVEEQALPLLDANEFLRSLSRTS